MLLGRQLVLCPVSSGSTTGSRRRLCLCARSGRRYTKRRCDASGWLRLPDKLDPAFARGSGLVVFRWPWLRALVGMLQSRVRGYLGGADVRAWPHTYSCSWPSQ